MPERVRPYMFYDVAISICATCFRRVDAKIVFQDDAVYMLKRCPQHGESRVLLADDVDYYRRCREVFIKRPEMPQKFNTPVKYGCPYDCGLCTDHQQHSCLSLIEITDHCNLQCPVCYADSGPARPGFRSLDHVQRMIDAVVRNEGIADVVQVSGGEPTLHPDFFAILDRMKVAPIRHVMVNTNGIRIAEDREFVERLAIIDAWSFDVRSVKKTCVHIVHPDGRLIPFDTYNLFYRDGLETSRLLPLRRNAELAAGEII